jgi:type I restriction enzyme S subunit
MIEELNPYPEYKESGLPWLLHVPRAWSVVRNGSLVRQRNETGHGELPILEVSIRSGVTVRKFENSARKQIMSDLKMYKRAIKGDIAYNMMRMWQGAVGVTPTDGLVSPAYVVACPTAGVHSHYFVALFKTACYLAEIDSCSRGIVKDRNRLYWDQFKQIRSPFPPPDEQAAIVRFLDYANGKIERAIRAKRKLIGLLNEQKQAIIHRAVTRGLDPNVKLKPSGIPWLGDVPEHWSIRRNSFLFAERLESGYAGLPILMVSLRTGVTEGSEIDENGREKRLIANVTKYKVADKGDIAYNMMRMWQGAVGVVPIRGMVSPAYVVARPLEGVYSPYFDYLYHTEDCKNEVNRYSRGIVTDRNRLYWDQFKRIYFPLPPFKEQKEISEWIEVETSALCKSIFREEREIELFREYRSTLTADVVTGKIDVREVTKTLPTIAESDEQHVSCDEEIEDLEIADS